MPLLVSSPMHILDPAIKCDICGKPILWKESKVTDDGFPVHEACLLAKNKEHTGPIRCPYCAVGDEFRPMATRAEGWLYCESCGHNAMPLDPEFRCVCSRCEASQSHTLPDSL